MIRAIPIRTTPEIFFKWDGDWNWLTYPELVGYFGDKNISFSVNKNGNKTLLVKNNMGWNEVPVGSYIRTDRYVISESYFDAEYRILSEKELNEDGGYIE